MRSLPWADEASRGRRIQEIGSSRRATFSECGQERNCQSLQNIENQNIIFRNCHKACVQAVRNFENQNGIF